MRSVRGAEALTANEPDGFWADWGPSDYGVLAGEG